MLLSFLFLRRNLGLKLLFLRRNILLAKFAFFLGYQQRLRLMNTFFAFTEPSLLVKLHSIIISIILVTLIFVRSILFGTVLTFLYLRIFIIPLVYSLLWHVDLMMVPILTQFCRREIIFNSPSDVVPLSPSIDVLIWWEKFAIAFQFKQGLFKPMRWFLRLRDHHILFFLLLLLMTPIVFAF